MNKYRILLAAVSCFLLAACPTTDTVVTSSSDTVLYDEESQILNKALRNITITSAESLKRAYLLLQDSNAGNSEYGRELSYVSFKLLSILYPLSVENVEEVSPPATSIYPSIFKEIEKGLFPEISQKDFSFLAFLISPVSLLFTDNAEVIEVCRETLNQLHLFNSGSIIPLFLSGYLSALEGNTEEALENFLNAKAVTGFCYPADLGIVDLKLEDDPEDALLLLDSLIIKFPGNPEFLIQAAAANIALENYSDALDITTELLRDNPENFSLLLLRAKIFKALGNYSQAQRLLLIIEDEMDTNVDFLLIKADILFAEEKIEESLAVLKEGMLLYPDNPLFNDAYGIQGLAVSAV